MNVIMELKKCCNHAFLVRPPDADDDHKDPFEVCGPVISGTIDIILVKFWCDIQWRFKKYFICVQL